MYATTVAGSVAVTGTGSSRRAADTFHALFLGSYDVENCTP